MPPKKQKTEPKKIGFQDLDPGLRHEIVEYLQPTNMQQAELRARYMMMAGDRNALKAFSEDADDAFFGNEIMGFLERQAQRSKTRYHENLERVTSAPGKWETYRYFWDDSKPYPDQGPNPGPGSGGPITT